MKNSLVELQKAEEKAAQLFREIENRELISAGKSEKQINTEIFLLADELLGIKKYWHKRIVRAGENTLFPYDENPKDLILKEDDILFIDFGPILEDWEADYGRTYVIGNDPHKEQLASDTEKLWHIANNYYKKDPSITGASLYQYCVELAQEYNWEFGGPIAGHLIGHFPHEKLDGEEKTNYIHPENHVPMNTKDSSGNTRHWILEIHLVDKKKKIGAFFEQLAGY
ncbi:metallopeptidase family M24 [Nonlabens dokdonensis]|jgi:Xaa-Pro aminopeptidase|uniref:Cytoplasmic aminopeptidase n=2 Tax=Nonlabens dokdonensis TaxID=328515 RepID=L7W8H4_NONDD|nr:M24 family metallopeptidase [Nonlabens dokdonensis]AGC75173.1 cytoplasmic aminopeptidase [Nonlabens dokdonensis DSW-6]PZX39083.1 metallopeptidase family M24 [Nonlabens dokdonensis]